jgi:hypothetical protein
VKPPIIASLITNAGKAHNVVLPFSVGRTTCHFFIIPTILIPVNVRNADARLLNPDEAIFNSAGVQCKKPQGAASEPCKMNYKCDHL